MGYKVFIITYLSVCCFTLANMNNSGSTATSLFNGSSSNKFGENNNKYETLPASNENTLLKQQKQQYQQQQQQTQQQQYQQQGFIDSGGLSSGGATQLRRTQSIISQNLRDQQYQLYCSGNSPPLQQQQQPSQQQYGETVVTQLQQQNVNNSYGSVGDAGLYSNSGPGGGPTNLIRQTQQQQAGIVSQQRQQQYSTSTPFTNNTGLSTEPNYLSTSGASNTAALKQFYNKRDGGGFDSSAGSDTRFNCQPQTYQQQQEVLYQPYQPEYATYQSQQQQPQQQLLYNQSQHQQPNQLQQSQQQYQQNQQYPQSQQQQYQRFPNQDQKQPQLGDHQPQYVVEQQQRVDNNYVQNATTLAHGSGLVSAGGTKFSENTTGLEPSSTAFRPLQQQGQVSSMI